MKSLLLAALACLLLTPALARDLPRTDPDRTALLDAARKGEAVKFIVKDLVRFGDLAYLCALKTEEGGIIGTDEALDIYRFALVKQGSRWLPWELGGNFALKPSQVDCSVEGTAVGSAEDVQEALLDRLQDDIRRDLDFGAPDKSAMAMLQTLRDKKLATDMDIEHAKEPYDPSQLKISNEHWCKDAACKAANRQTFDRLNALGTQANVSSLAWNQCGYGRRVFNLAVNLQCVQALSPLPYCRAHMKLLQDRPNIDRCMAEAKALCRRTFPNADDQKLVCS